MALKYLYAPSGAKAGTAYGVLPNSANADFSSFSRNGAGSRVDKNGLINTGLGLGGEEIVNGSFSSDSNWIKQDNWQISNGNANTSSAITTTAWVYQLKNNTYDINKVFEISADIVVNSGNCQIGIGGSLSPSITESGKYSFTLTMAANHTFAGCRAQTGFEGSIDNISVREVTEVNTDVPRLDYTGGGCPSLLLETTSTNYVEYSEDFIQSPWTKINSTITSNTGISPNGGQNADKLYFNGAFNASLRETITTTSTDVYTFSIWIKKISANYTSNDKARIEAFGSGTVGFLLLGDTLNSAAVGESVRYSVTTTASTGGTSYFQFRSDEEATFEVWGAQVEPLSYATSYIPNYGNAAGVTRSQDTGGSTGDLSSVINSTEGTFFLNIKYSKSTESNKNISISKNGTADFRFFVQLVGQNLRTQLYNNGVNSFQVTDTSFSPYIYNKIAIKWKENEYKLYVNGVFIGEDLSGSVPAEGTLDELVLGAWNETNNFLGNIKQIRIYDESLSDAEMTKLTTL